MVYGIARTDGLTFGRAGRPLKLAKCAPETDGKDGKAADEGKRNHFDSAVEEFPIVRATQMGIDLEIF